MTSSNLLGRSVVAVLLLAVVSALTPVPAGAQDVPTPLRAHRERARLKAPAAGPVLDGTVTALTDDTITTSIGRDQVLGGGVHDEDIVTLRLAGRTITARFLEATTLAALLGSPAGLDVDVVCTTDAQAAVVIVGLGGGLPGWLRVRPGMRVVLEKP